MENKEKPGKNLRITDIQGRIIEPSSWNIENIDEEAERILREAEVGTFSPEGNIQLKPTFSEGLIKQYEFFRKNIYEPKRVFYPCSHIDASPVKAFPNSEVVLMDNDPVAARAMRDYQIKQFIEGDATKHNPTKPYNLIILLNPTLASKDLTKSLADKGYVMANNWCNNASSLLENPEFQGIGTIDSKDQGESFYLARNFNRLTPRQFETFFYVFRKK